MAKRSGKQPSDDDLKGLYGAPFDEFVKERDELAKRLRADGDREQADEVKQLKKPSRSAWAVNQGVRADAAAAKRLIKAGEDLDAAQGKALGGSGQEALRDAMSDQQEAVEHMMGAVESGTAEHGELSSAVLDRVRETLRAVAGDAELRGGVRRRPGHARQASRGIRRGREARTVTSVRPAKGEAERGSPAQGRAGREAGATRPGYRDEARQGGPTTAVPGAEGR
jgi:hypothetical protein